MGQDKLNRSLLSDRFLSHVRPVMTPMPPLPSRGSASARVCLEVTGKPDTVPVRLQRGKEFVRVSHVTLLQLAPRTLHPTILKRLLDGDAIKKTSSLDFLDLSSAQESRRTSKSVVRKKPTHT
jgi:hypothetical protein